MPVTKKKMKSDGSFATTGQKAAEALRDLEDDVKRQSIRSVNFDSHFIVEKSILFGKALTGIPLYDYQEATAYAIIHSVVTGQNETLSMLFSRQSGKTETLAFVIDTLSVLLPALAKFIPDLEQFKDGVKIGLFAPQSDQVWTTYNRALMRLSTDNAEQVMGDPDLEVRLDKPTKFELTNGSSLTAQVASKQSKIEGKTYDLVIIEEAQDVDSYIVQKAIEPMVSATGGTIVKCGTTGTSKNHFWYDIQYNKNLNRKQKDKRLFYHWEFDYKQIIRDKRKQFEKDNKIFHLGYEKDVLKKRERLGAESTVFKLNYALLWDLESGMLITDKEFEAITNKKMGHVIEKNDIIIAGLDIGKEEASTVVTLGKIVWEPNDEDEPPKIVVVGWLELHKLDYEIQHHAIVEYLFENNVQNLFADYTGVGKAVVDRLMYSLGDAISVEPFTFSKQSKSEMWFNLIDYIQTGRLIIPANKKVRELPEWEKFEEQLTNCSKNYDGPYLVCQKGDGFHDDYVDSLALMCLATNFEVAEEIEEEPFSPFFSDQLENRNLRHDNNW